MPVTKQGYERIKRLHEQGILDFRGLGGEVCGVFPG